MKPSTPDNSKVVSVIPNRFDGADVEGSLWLLVPRVAVGIAASVFLVLAGFWLQLGEIPMYAIGFCVFLIALQILLIVGLRFGNRPEVHTKVAPKNGLLDKIGAWWLMACAFGAFFGWVAGTLVSFSPEYWYLFLSFKVFLTILLPVATMLPNIRYISRNAAYIQVPIMFVVTLLPILVGLGAAMTLIAGVRR